MLCFLSILLLLASCNFSNEDKVKALIKEEIKKTLFLPDSYEAVETKVDSAFTPYDSPEFIEEAAMLAQYAVDINEVQEDIKNAKSSMAIWSGNYMTTFSRNEYQEAKSKHRQSVAKEQAIKKKAQKITNQIRKKLKEAPAFIGYKAMHTYRAKNNAGQVLMGYALFIFDKEMKNVIAQYDMESKEYVASQAIKSEIEEEQ